MVTGKRYIMVTSQAVTVLKLFHQLTLFIYYYTLYYEQVDILISKNQALQILYLKHIKLHKLATVIELTARLFKNIT